MIVGTDKLLSWFHYNEKPFWIIRRSEKSDMIARSPEDDNTLDVPKSKELLNQALSFLNPEIYYIQTWGGSDPKSTTGLKTSVHFRITDNENKQPAIPGIGYVDPSTMEQKINERVEEKMTAWKKEQELLNRIGALEKQLTEDKDDGTTIERIFDRAERYIGYFDPEFTKRIKSPVVGEMKKINKEEIKEMNSEQTKKLEDALGVLQAKVGEDKLPDMMTKLAALSQNDPDTFDYAMSKLLK